MNDEIFSIIAAEKKRQREQLQMIPSENYASKDVMRAVGSVLMNKYAEGDPGRRYYQGNEIVDEVERLCENRVLKAFGLDATHWQANVQPHSGCEANLVVYNAMLEPGDRIMSMFLPDGGHLSHGWHIGDKKVTLVSKIFDVHFYHVEKKTRVFDYEKLAEQAKRVKPRMIITGGTAYPREINYRKMAHIAKSVGAFYMADIAHEAGLIAAGAMRSPFPLADFVTFTTHKTLRGPRGAVIVCRKRFGTFIDRSIIPGVQGGPHLHSIAGIAVALREAGTKRFETYAHQVVRNAAVLAKEFMNAGLDVVSGGTDKHLVLLDLRSVGLTGWTVAWALEYANIIMNRNTVPYDTGSPFYPSGLRMGTPAITTRGMKEREMKKIAGWIIEIIKHSKQWPMPEEKEKRQRFVKGFRTILEKDRKLQSLKKEVRLFASKYSVPA